MTEAADILVMCTANRGRSPFTEHLLRKLLDDRGLSGAARVHSAGLCCHELGREGMGADPKVVALGEQYGLDISGHEAKPMNPDMLAQCDLAIVMEDWQVKVLDLSLSAGGKTVTLRQIGGAGDAQTSPDIAKASDRERKDFGAEALRCLEYGLDNGPLADLIASRAG